MDSHLDWLSFTLETVREPSDAHDLYYLAQSLIKQQIGDEQHVSTIWNGTGFEQTIGRAPYRLCLERDDHGCRLYGDSPTKTVLYELSGRGMQGLHEYDDARATLAPIIHRVSRLDWAVDIRTGTRPAEFANDRNHQSFRSLSFIRSDTGETVYIGSPKSDRFCRVYRYNPPHPRSELLRVEFVFRRGLARIAAQDLVASKDAAHFTATLGNTWGLAHRDWKPGWVTDERVKTAPTTQKQEDTVAWLYKQVAPAMRRMIESGAIDLTDWLQVVYGQNEVSVDIDS